MTIQVKKFPTNFLASDNDQDISPDTTPIKLIKISPGLTGENGTVSFQSVDDPTLYLANDNYTLGLRSVDDFDDPESFAKESTFIEKMNEFLNDSVALESVAHPSYFITCDDDEFILQKQDEGGDTFDENASLKIIHPADIQGEKINTIVAYQFKIVIYYVSEN